MVRYAAAMKMSASASRLCSITRNKNCHFLAALGKFDMSRLPHRAATKPKQDIFDRQVNLEYQCRRCLPHAACSPAFPSLGVDVDALCSTNKKSNSACCC